MSKKRIVRVGVIGCGLMGREFASASGRWCSLTDVDFKPVITAACDINPKMLQWFQDNVDTVQIATDDYHHLLTSEAVEAVYCAPPHNLHEQMYVDIIRAGKHLLGEKPFGIDLPANRAILKAIKENPKVLVRCSSEFVFFPGAYEVLRMLREEDFGGILEVEAGVLHCSDLNPDKPINWKRMAKTNGEYGCMGDLGMHCAHLPLRVGWMPSTVHARLVNMMKQRPDPDGALVPCDTWDNAILSCGVETKTQSFPLILTTKRIAPGHNHTWYIRIWGTRKSVEYSTRDPKTLRVLDYKPGGGQVWQEWDFPFKSAYASITPSGLEFGFPDSMVQMWAAFCDEILNGREGMKQPLYCATPEEAEQVHCILTAALESERSGKEVATASL